MKKFDCLKLAVIGTMMILSVNGFGQDCDKYLNPQTNTVKTKDVVLNVLKGLGKASDVILGTNFSSLTRPTDQLHALDNLQYQACVQLQTIKNEFTRENTEGKIRGIMGDMVKLINETGTLPPDAVKQLVANGVLTPSQAQANGVITPSTEMAKKIANADDVPVPILPDPAPVGTWNTVTFPCQANTVSSVGIIRAHGMESSMDAQIAKNVATVIALEELASKIEVTVKSTTQYFIDRTVTNLNEELTTKFNRTIDISVNQTIRGYRNICEEYRQHSTTQKYQYFVAIEIDEDAVLKPIHDELKQDPELQKAVPNYKKFKDAFNETLKYYEKIGIN